MLNLDPAKLLVILVIALVVLGPDRLPHAARQLGTAWRTLTHLREQIDEEVRRALPDIDIPRLPRTGSVTSFLTDLTRPPDIDRSSPSTSGRSADSVGEVREPPDGPAEPRSALIAANDPSMN